MGSANAQVSAIEDLSWSGDALDRLSELRGARDLIDYLIDKAVEECRTTGQEHGLDVVENVDGTTLTRETSSPKPISWERIGDALAISRQTAWERYRHVV